MQKAVIIEGIWITSVSPRELPDGTRYTHCLVEEGDLPTLKASLGDAVIGTEDDPVEKLPKRYKRADGSTPYHLWAGHPYYKAAAVTPVADGDITDLKQPKVVM